MRKVQKIKNDLIYYMVIAAIRCFNLIPRGMAVYIGAGIGFIVYLLRKQDRRKAHRNLQMVYKDRLSASERKSIVRRVFTNFGRNLADVLRLKKYSSSQIMSLIDCEGIEHFDRVYHRGKGVIAATGHIGNFELLAAYFAASGYKVAAIGREMYDKRLNRLLVENRETMGLRNIDTQDSPRQMLKFLREGYALGVLIDTDSMRVRSEFIPAFGKLSYTPVGQTILGLRSGAGFVPIACVRAGKRYKVIVKPEVAVERSGDFNKDVYNITLKCTKALEEIINEHKDQWIWVHNRWLTRPKEPIK